MNSLTSGNQIIVLTKDGSDKWVNSKIEFSLGAQSLGSNRWLPTPPISSGDPIGVNGSEAYKITGPATADYYLKIGSTWFRTQLTIF